MAASNFSGPVASPGGFTGNLTGQVTNTSGDGVLYCKRVTLAVTDGAHASTFTMPSGAFVERIICETPVAIPGSPTNTNLRLGSAANGQQYVADVDVKAQAAVALTLLYAGRNIATTVHATVASTGGTAADQDGSLRLFVYYTLH